MWKPNSKQKKPRLSSLGVPLERETDKTICALGSEQGRCLHRLPNADQGETSHPTWSARFLLPGSILAAATEAQEKAHSGEHS